MNLGREFESEDRAEADLAFYGELATHRARQLTSDVQAETGSRLHMVVVETLEAIEDALEMLAGNARPGVDHADHQTLGLLVHLDPHPAVGRVLQRVADQV